MKRRNKILLVSAIAALLTVNVIFTNISWAAELNWVGCGIAKKAFMGALGQAYEKKTGIKIRLEGGGATRGIVDVASGKADMGGTCRHIILREEEKGVKLTPIGWDALVVIAHPSNDVKGITIEQLKNIYLGKIKNWKELGGPDRKIRIVERSSKISGVGRMFREIVFHNPAQEFTSDAKLVEESEGVESTVEKDPGMIAVTGISSAQKRKIKLLEINGKVPSRENISKGSYLLYRPLYLVTKSQPSPAVSKFMAFALSNEGQAVISGEGTVTLAEGAKLWDKYRQEMTRSGTASGTY